MLLVFYALRKNPRHLFLSRRCFSTVSVPKHEGCSSYSRFVSGLQQCIRSKSLVEGQKLLSQIASSSLRGDTYLGNLLILLYGNGNNAAESWRVFNEFIHRRNVFSWNTMMGSFNACSQEDHAMEVFLRIPQWDLVSWNSFLQANAQAGDLATLQKSFTSMPERGVITWNTAIASCLQFDNHDLAIEFFSRMPEHTVVTWTSILTCFARRGDLVGASRLFHSMPERNDVSWSAMAAAYTEHFFPDSAIDLVGKMPQWSTPAQSSLIQALLQCRRLDQAWIIFLGMSQRNEFAWNILLQGLFCSDLAWAELVLDRMPGWDVVTCNTSIVGYTMTGNLARAREIFLVMPQSSVASWNAMLDAFARSNAVEEACRIFSLMPGHDAVSCSGMLGVYAQNGHTTAAERLFEQMPAGKTIFAWNSMLHAWSQGRDPHTVAAIFDRMPGHDLVSWNTLLGAYARVGSAKEAVRTFSRMDLEALSIDDVTFLGILDSISSSSGLQSKLLLDELLGDGDFSTLLQSSCTVTSALVTACSKCGYLAEAWTVFREARHRDIACWSSMISAYATNGYEVQALELVRYMVLSGLCPDAALLVILLSACSHAGLFDAGLGLFRFLSQDFGLDVNSGLDHYSCVIDLLARTGRLDAAMAVIEEMPLEPSVLVWTSVLAACTVHGDGTNAVIAAEEICAASPENGVAYVLLSNLEKSRGRR